MFEKLKNNLDDQFFACFKKDDEKIEIMRYLSNTSMLDPEVSLYMKRKNDQFLIYKINRNRHKLIATLESESISYFYLYFLAMLSVEDELNPRPSEADFEDNVSVEYVKRIFNEFLDRELYEIFSMKNEALCLSEESENYVVYYVDREGNKFTISDDNYSFGLGVSVLFNYVWDFMWLKKLSREWNLNIHESDKDYEKIVKNVMGVD
ncbi:hypothetical protein [Amphibacillus cookii]|uniref:hypothetical protein n=1 Tax=Amphibacillus cookii TaxID=767787 RepID=UPI00195E484C|nr:hypothetical protein [Amphibacillus cookii]MBM7542025.1 hypothetical protein [Amphibacillus cookii]